MARLHDEDFFRLKKYIESYSLAGAIESKIREQSIKRAHKYTLGALQILIILESFSAKKNLKLNGIEIKADSIAHHQISECFSDLTNSFFAELHGLHKPAMMALRSAIETFVRGVAGSHSDEALTTKNVNRLFEIAKLLKPFTGKSAKYFESLRSNYGVLCDYTHSYSPAHMMKNHAIANFPKYDTSSLKKWLAVYTGMVASVLAIIIYSNKLIYNKAGAKAQDVLDEVIPKDVRMFALGAPSQN